MPISSTEMGIFVIFEGHLNPSQSIHQIIMIIQQTVNQ